MDGRFEPESTGSTNPQPQPANVEPKPSALNELVVSMFEKYGDNIVEAAKHMALEVLDNDRLVREFAEPLVESWCYERLREMCQIKRRKIGDVMRDADTAEKGAERLRNLGMSLLDFQLPGGKPLRDATGVECSEASRFYIIQASTMAARSRWLKDIAAIAKGNKVGRVMNETQLSKLWKRAES